MLDLPRSNRVFLLLDMSYGQRLENAQEEVPTPVSRFFRLDASYRILLIEIYEPSIVHTGATISYTPSFHSGRRLVDLLPKARGFGKVEVVHEDPVGFMHSALHYVC